MDETRLLQQMCAAATKIDDQAAMISSALKGVLACRMTDPSQESSDLNKIFM